MPSARSLKLFHKAAEHLPAYKEFLQQAGCRPEKIRTADTFGQVPLTDKKSYLIPNKLEDLVWRSELEGLLLFCSTSGSTGTPYYFPRNERLSWQYSFALEKFLKQSSYGQGRTLVIIGFGMGVWIGGVITMRAFEIAAQRIKQPVALLPAGYNKPEIFKALRRLSPDFDQTVIVGYPPFVKELVDESTAEGVDLKKLNIRFLFAAESFTETFRNYLCDEAGVKDPLRDTLNIYGTADIGAMANETPLSILIRRLAREDPLLYCDIFGQIEKTPTLAQYNPDFIEFEAVNGELVLTSDGALPLIRYAVGDHGGVFEYQHLAKLFTKYAIDLDAEIEKAGLTNLADKQLPFVYVYERKDLAVTLHGIIVYPEYVKEGLLTPEMAAIVTQRFTMATKYDIHHNQFIQVNVELKQGIKPNKTLGRKVHKAIRTSMLQKSSEFVVVDSSKPKSDLVQVVLWKNGDPRYFAPGTKQKWVEK